MSPNVLEREEVAVTSVQRVPQGCSAHVVPTAAFAEVALDSAFTGTASRDACAPYFSQLDNLDTMVHLYSHYAPAPVRDRVMFVRIGVRPFDAAPVELVVKAVTAIAPVPAASSAVGPAAAPQMRLTELTEQMRDFVDLPVQDLARMCGIGRRQYYNLLRGKAETMRTPDGEKRLRLVHGYLSELHKQLSTAARTAAAVLMPLGKHNMSSLMDIAGSQEIAAVQSAYEDLFAQLNSGVRPSPDELPPSGKLPANDERWSEAGDFLRDYRPVDE